MAAVILGPYQTIIEVGWGSGVAIVELIIDKLSTNSYDVEPSDPTGQFIQNFVFSLVPEGALVGPACTPADYKDQYGLFLIPAFGSPAPTVGPPIILENAIPGVLDFVASEVLATSTHTANLAQVAADTAQLGFSPQIHLTDEVAVPLLGYTATQPDGRIISYVSGYTTSPLLGFESWYWYVTVTKPATTTQMIRQNWLINFASGKTKTAKITSDGGSSPVATTTKITLTIYPAGSTFTLGTDGVVTSDKKAKVSFVTNSPSSTLVLKNFNRLGFIPPIPPTPPP